VIVLLRRRQWRCWTRTAASLCNLRRRAWTVCHERSAQATVAVLDEGGRIMAHSATQSVDANLLNHIPGALCNAVHRCNPVGPHIEVANFLHRRRWRCRTRAAASRCTPRRRAWTRCSGSWLPPSASPSTRCGNACHNCYHTLQQAQPS